MRSAFILLVALQWLFRRFISFISFRVIASFFRPPTLFLYIHIAPGQYRIDIGVCLALRRPEYASCRPLFGLPSVAGLPKHCYSNSPCALNHEHGSDVANEALISCQDLLSEPKALIYDGCMRWHRALFSKSVLLWDLEWGIVYLSLNWVSQDSHMRFEGRIDDHSKRN